MRILLVDDEPVIRTLTRALLLSDGHEVIVAENGAEAVEICGRGWFDLVLMDVVMPEMDGFEATRRIKRMEREEFLPVIFLTSLTDMESMTRGLECGGDDFISKPINPTVLRARIGVMARIRQMSVKVREELDHYRSITQREQEVARHLFDRFTRHNEIERCSISRLSRSYSEFTGDLFLAAHRPTGGVNVVMGDFCGKGLSAAVGAMPFADVFYEMSQKGFSIGEIIREVNGRLVELLPSDMFCAASFLSFDPDHSTVMVWNAGMPDILILDSGGALRRIGSSQIPLGIVTYDWSDVRPEILHISPETRIILYSDGLIEACNERQEQFGIDRLIAAIELGAADNSCVERVTRDLDEFIGQAAQDDDISLIRISGADLCQCSLVGSSFVEKSKRPAAEWRMEAWFSAQSLRGFELPPVVSDFFSKVQAPQGHYDRICTVITELYSNALEHGLLRIDSAIKVGPDGFAEYYRLREERLAALCDGWVSVRLSHRPLGAQSGELEIVIRDSGPGFDPGPLVADIAGSKYLAGRGIALVNALCERLEYGEDGTEVTALYRWGTAGP